MSDFTLMITDLPSDQDILNSEQKSDDENDEEPQSMYHKIMSLSFFGGAKSTSKGKLAAKTR